MLKGISQLRVFMSLLAPARVLTTDHTSDVRGNLVAGIMTRS